jgi:phosphoglycolate phosphatase
MNGISHIFFDLDGTIIDSSPGIFRCFRAALAELGLPDKTDEELSEMIGPPLSFGMSRLIDSDDTAAVERAVALYRKHYGAGGMFEVNVYPGIADSIREFRKTGMKVFCVTGKAKPFAEKILERIGVLPLMEGVYGPGLDSRNTEKADLIRELLSDEKVHSSKCAMVGDRKFDIEGALLCGVHAVGVTWGFGSREELETAGAEIIAESADNLVKTVQAISRQ